MNKNKIIKTNLLILGGGPAGYTAALNASKLDMTIILLEKFTQLGGVCLNSGCIPTKALLHISSQLYDMEYLNNIGIEHKIHNINIKKIHKWKNSIIKNLKYNLKLSLKKKVTIFDAYGKFLTTDSVELMLKGKQYIINFDHAIIATGSREKNIKSKYGRLLNSNDALNLNYIPKNLLIVGAGFVGLEIATIFISFNVNVDILEKKNTMLDLFDDDIKNIFFYSFEKKVRNIYTNVQIIKIEEFNDKVLVKLSNNKILKYEYVIFATGRYPNTDNLNLNKIGINLTDEHFIKINNKCETNYKNIYACGDVTGHPMLAHKAFYQARGIIDIISGNDSLIEDKYIPVVLHSIPEISQIGITENIAKKLKIKYFINKILWNKNGKSIIINSENGLSKIVLDENNIIIGATIIGKNSGELISELSLAIEMRCHKNDLLLTVHPHPSLSETIYFALNINDNLIKQ